MRWRGRGGFRRNLDEGQSSGDKAIRRDQKVFVPKAKDQQGKGHANAAEMTSRSTVGFGAEEEGERPDLWPSILLKKINNFTRAGRDKGQGDPTRRAAQSLIAAELRRKKRILLRRKIRANIRRIGERLAKEVSDAGAGIDGSASGGEEPAGAAEGGPEQPSPQPGQPSNNTDKPEGTNPKSPRFTSSSEPAWPDVSALSSAAYEKLKEARESLIIPPFIREFNEQMKGGFPNKRRLDVVQEFFKYTEDEARRFFDELDRDKDGVVTLADMKAEMKRRNLPEKYANNFIKRAKRHAKWPFGNSIVWEDFRSLNQERESAMLANFNALEVSQFGSLKKHQIKSLLEKMQFNASDDNAESMLKYLDADASGYVSYGKYRNFLILIPKEKIAAKDIGLMWFESATMVPMIVPSNSSKKMLVLSTLASAVISGTSTLALHPLDTVKTMLQASSGQSMVSVFKEAAKMGRTGLYRGIIPATVGAASSQGFRVGVFEAAKLGTKVLLPSIPDLQVQTIASGMGSFIGTAVRIPCEVLKQRLQAGQYTEVWTAIATVMKKDGVGGLFRGSAATLSREIPFYVIGMVAYEQFKKAAVEYSREKRGRDLEAWETIAVGALSGAVAAALTTPFDVLKTRLMTSAVGAKSVTIGQLAAQLVREEGPGALFKGALPRAMWIAPVGAMNFAGYELAKNAMSSE